MASNKAPRVRTEPQNKAINAAPWFESLNGQDAEAFIWSANVKRRQMSKGQMAMIAAVSFTAIETIAVKGQMAMIPASLSDLLGSKRSRSIAASSLDTKEQNGNELDQRGQSESHRRAAKQAGVTPGGGADSPGASA